MKTQQEDLFQIFWQEYPRKRAKIDAQRAWRRLNPSESDTFAILLGVQAYVCSGEWKESSIYTLPGHFFAS